MNLTSQSNKETLNEEAIPFQPGMASLFYIISFSTSNSA